MDLTEIQTTILTDPERASAWVKDCIEQIREAVRVGLEPMRPPENLRLSQWADEHFYLSRESSYAESKWTAYPFQRAILDCMGHDQIASVTFRKSSRVGYTKCVLASITFNAQHRRRNQLVYQPTDDDSDEFVKTELDPVLRDMKVMQSVFTEDLRRDKRNTLRQKSFLGSTLHLRGGKAAKNYRRLTVDTVYMDEGDGFDHDVEKKGNPRKLAQKRVEGATYPKFILGSTPETKGLSIIDEAMSEAELTVRYYVPCPHCEAMITLRWGDAKSPYGMKWVNKDPETAAYQCEHCAGLFRQPEYLAVWGRGRWMSASGVWIDDECRFRSSTGELLPVPGSIGFDIWTAYSPQATWPAIVQEFLAASAKAEQGDFSLLKTFVNLTLGESWEEKGETTDEHALAERAKIDPYQRGTVPKGVLIIFAAVDVQQDRFEVSYWGFGRNGTQALIDHQVIEANPALDSEWGKLDAILQMSFDRGAGLRMKVEAMGVDSGGHFTQQAYVYGRSRRHLKVRILRGEPLEGRPIRSKSSLVDIDHRGQKVKAGVKLHFVGTDTAKDLLHGRLSVQTSGPGYVRFPVGMPKEYFEQITGETRIQVKTPYGTKFRWVKRRPRNEALDCAVYAIWLSHEFRLDRMSEAEWDRLEALHATPTLSLFDAPQAPIEPVVVPQAVPAAPALPRPASRPARSDFGSDGWSSRL